MNIGQTLKIVEKEHLRKKRLPFFSPGDVVKVHLRIREGEKERIQVFEGVVIARKGHSTCEMFKVRRIASGVGVERTFVIHSPMISDIKVVKRGDVNRAKLYYLRGKTGKHAKIKQLRRDKMLQLQAREQKAVEEEQAASAVAAAAEAASQAEKEKAAQAEQAQTAEKATEA